MESAGDRLSALPDDVLLDIVKHLDLRTTVRVGALSRRWRHIPRSLSDLRIVVPDLIPRDASSYSPTLHTVERIMTAYTAAARWLLSSSSPSRQRKDIIKTMSLGFYLANPHLHSIGRAVEGVVRSGNTERLSFKIWVDGADDDGRAVVGDDDDDFSDELRLAFGRRFMSFFHACPTAFRWLIHLTQSYLSFGDQDLPTLLNACGKLEFLSLRNCDFADDDGAVLRIDAPCSQLLELELRLCDFQSVELIRAPKIGTVVCDTWQGDNPPVQFGHVPWLRNIYFGSQCHDWQEPFVLSEWLSNARNLTTMCLDFHDQKIWVKPEDPKLMSPVFSKLRDLYIHGIFHDCDLGWTLSVLEAASSVKNFYISIPRHTCGLSIYRYSDEKANNVPREASRFEHHNLSLLQVAGFAVEKKMMQYIRLIIQRAVRLKKIRLLEQLLCESCDAVEVHGPSLTDGPKVPVDERHRKLVRERLTDGLSSSVEISIGC
ncbi:hypothetical protein C2845_PM07G04710 [Panicum miliaceum]|uniref:F-box domain-containing protein n=1 Tax=Panicum miliaceum TaxID=4540 RepID=A0A3L6STY6_PANMI|nr:hypothetical protein C2845_PM07G04710 [Panicum miliaceum]